MLHASHTRSTVAPPAIRRRGMTLVELAVGLALVSAVMSGLVLVNRTLRLEAAEAETRQTLVVLQHALRAYTDAAVPSDPPSGPVGDALATLQAHPAAAAHLAELDLTRDAHGQLQVLDGYGRPIRYQARDGDRPLPASFVSAGPSGRFGVADASGAGHTDVRRHAADNLYGFELEAPTP
ncbi:MAG: type II secretion system protein [Phycisphaeraceae bacterium]